MGSRAIAPTVPVIFDAHVSADIAQLPPHISFEEAHKFFSALIAGDPDERGIIKEQIKSVIAGLIAKPRKIQNMSVASVRRAQCPIDRVDVCAYRVPTEGGPESDGTARWDASTMVFVEIAGGGETGIGYTYADAATARVVREELQRAARRQRRP